MGFRELPESMPSIQKNLPTAPAKGLGDVVERLAKPVAKALNLPCLDKSTGRLRPESGCAKRRDRMNKAIPFTHDNDTPDPTAISIPEEVPRTDGTQGVGSP